MADSVSFGNNSVHHSDTATFVIKSTEAPPEEAPPIPLWKLGLIALTIIGAGGAVALYKNKGGKK